HERVQRGSDRPPRIEDVVDEDDGLAGDGVRGQRRRADLGLGQPFEDVVAIERDVDGAGGGLELAGVVDEAGQALGERHARGADADEHHVPDGGVALDDLVRDALERANDAGRIEELALFDEARVVLAHGLLWYYT